MMELSGNLRERVITTENGQGRNFNKNIFPGTYLNDLGHAFLASSWPGAKIDPVFPNIIDGSIPALGLMYRGGSWNDESFFLSISDRSGPLINDTNTNRDPYTGIRGCR
ncbi:MAG: hypothetical protein IPJ13_04225 [Saprospiraceae bacterium]|nr:hypothetical protein [Saprospiraceae bacterium]